MLQFSKGLKRALFERNSIPVINRFKNLIMAGYCELSLRQIIYKYDLFYRNDLYEEVKNLPGGTYTDLGE